MLILMVYFNVRISRKHVVWSVVIGCHCVGSTNGNTFRLIALCSKQNAIITNTFSTCISCSKVGICNQGPGIGSLFGTSLSDAAIFHLLVPFQ